MMESRRFGVVDLLLLVLVVGTAAGVRSWYLCSAADYAGNDGPLQVQDARPPLALPADAELRGKSSPNELDALIHNLKEHSWFGCLAPFASDEEQTAHTAPGYPWLLSLLERSPLDLAPVDRAVRWIQCGLGSLSAGLYFLFARAAFRSRLVAGLAGLLGALHPFAIIATAEIDDGVLAAFLLALAVWLGARAGQQGGAFTSLLYGLTLAGLALVRAALLPFAFVAVLWFLLRCRSLRSGWLYATVAFLGFLIGVAPWTLRNHQVLGDLVPIVDSTYLHLWMGNHPEATGGPQSEPMMLAALARSRGEDPATTAEQLAGVKNQRQRYAQLGREVMRQIQADPASAVRRRLQAALCFLVGEEWLKTGELARKDQLAQRELPAWLADSYPAILQGTLLGMLLLAGLGWRWTWGWRHEAMPSSLAIIWIPLPYLLSHAASYSGPRLPLDGILLTYAAFALACCVPGVSGYLLQGAPKEAGGVSQDEAPTSLA